MGSRYLSTAQLQSWFVALDNFLLTQQSFWRERPFTTRSLAWESQAPELSAWLRSQSLAHAEHYQAHPTKLIGAPAPYTELALLSQQLTQLPASCSRTLPTRPAYLSRDVPGRKWQQIASLAEAITPIDSTAQPHWLDWCAGKGHLARYLAWPDQTYSCLEYDPKLVAAGQQLTDKLGLPGQHQCQDVMQPEAVEFLSGTLPVALHACGDLHRQLIQGVIGQAVTQLAVVPCCYNRTATEQYRPLSKLAKASLLALSKTDLALPLQSTVTANRRETAQRDQSMAWRLAFDIYQRQVRDVDQYLSTPTLGREWWKQSFAEWCQNLAALKKIAVKPATDWLTLEQQGWQRLAQVRNLELVQGLFKRPLELWLLLDLALYLSESGYQVALSTFCPESLTPRNILLQAVLKK